LFYIATFLSSTAIHCYVKTRGTAIHARSVLSTLKRSAIIQLQLHVSMLCWYYLHKHRHFFVSRSYLLFIVIQNSHSHIRHMIFVGLINYHFAAESKRC